MDPDSIRRILRSVPLFSELADGEIEELVTASRGVRFNKGARIFEEGTPADCCFVLTAGRAQVVLSGNKGAEILLQILVPNGLVGEVALLDKSARSASLVAAEHCHLIRIPASALDRLRRNQAFETKLVAGLAARLRESDERVRIISTFPSLTRVAWCLARVARHSGRRERATIVIPRVAHSELADMAGCTRETVSRALQTLRKKRLVSWDEDTMRLEVDALQRYLSTELLVPPNPPPLW